MNDPIIVAGSGLAGLLCARALADTHPVLVLTKSSLFDSNTQYSQGGIAAVWSPEDSVDLHVRDTMNAGQGHCDGRAVSILSRQSHKAIQKLIELGAKFDKDGGDNYLLGLEGAHSINRVLHAGGDATGREIQRALVESVIQHPNIDAVENCAVTWIQTSAGALSEIHYYRDGKKKIASCAMAILATGGAGQLFKNTSNPAVATGDGVVLAYLAGASLMDMEFYQFHPTALNLAGKPNFLISEAVRGEGAVLRNKSGELFMNRVHPQSNLAPRDIVARAIATEMRLTGETVYLDAAKLGEKIPGRFPTIFNRCLDYGLDMRKEMIPVAPAAHYMMGGVATDSWGQTTIPGLYACGEVARTGVHGANRLASNSLLEAAVFALRVAQHIRQNPVPKKSSAPKNRPDPARETNSWTKDEFREAMWNRVGLFRSEKSLQSICDSLGHPALPDPEHVSFQEFEISSMKLLGKLIAESALERRESRGAHYREDFPDFYEIPPDPIIKKIAS